MDERLDSTEWRANTVGDDPDLAVALSYDQERDGAPRIVAKGTGELAARIVEVARANGITIRRDADLAQILSALEIDAEIPEGAFLAVAEILSYVYQTNRRMGVENTAKTAGDKA